MDKDIFMISFSGGRTSAFMTEKLISSLSADQIVICFANTGKEEEATLQFVDQCDKRWGGIINWIEYDPALKFKVVDFRSASRAGQPYQAALERRSYLPNVVVRYCTQDLKIRPIKWFMRSLGYRRWTNVVGIRYDEPARWSKTRQIADKECWYTWLPLVDWKITKEQVLDYWRQMPFDLQLKEYEGNCDLCFLKGKSKIKKILTDDPSKAEWCIEQERKTGHTFHKGYSVSQLLSLIKKAPHVFDIPDPDIECFCNLD